MLAQRSDPIQLFTVHIGYEEPFSYTKINQDYAIDMLFYQSFECDVVTHPCSNSNGL